MDEFWETHEAISRSFMSVYNYLASWYYHVMIVELIALWYAIQIYRGADELLTNFLFWTMWHVIRMVILGSFVCLGIDLVLNYLKVGRKRPLLVQVYQVSRRTRLAEENPLSWCWCGLRRYEADLAEHLAVWTLLPLIVTCAMINRWLKRFGIVSTSRRRVHHRKRRTTRRRAPKSRIRPQVPATTPPIRKKIRKKAKPAQLPQRAGESLFAIPGARRK